MMPINIIDVLTAATPIVASVASIFAVNKKSDCKQEETVPEQQHSVNINITNHFYTNNKKDSIEAAKIVEEQIKSSFVESGIRYIL